MAVTRADVARHAGVSPAVVSYVLHPGTRPVAESTRRRVLAVISELGYRPNAVAQALRGHATRSIGLVVPDTMNPFFAELAHAIEDEAFRRGYVVITGNASDDPEREEYYLRTMADRQIDALVLVSVSPRPGLAALVEHGVPVVVLDRAARVEGASTVLADALTGARRAVEHLVGLGHRTIACIAGPADVSAADDRIEGWRAGLGAAGLGSSGLLLRAPFTLEGGASVGQELLDATDRPTAVFVSSDIQAMGLLSMLHRSGVRVPDDLAVVSYDGTDMSSYTVPPLTTVRQPIDRLAQIAVGRVVERVEAGLAAGGPAETHDLLATELVVRASSGVAHTGL